MITFCAASLFATGGSNPPETLDDLYDALRTLRAESEDPAYILMDEGLSPDMTTAMEEFTEADHCISGYKRDLQKKPGSIRLPGTQLLPSISIPIFHIPFSLNASIVCRLALFKRFECDNLFRLAYAASVIISLPSRYARRL